MENCSECQLRPQSKACRERFNHMEDCTLTELSTIQQSLSITTLKQFELFMEAYQEAVFEIAFASFEDGKNVQEVGYSLMLFELIKQKLNVTN